MDSGTFRKALRAVLLSIAALVAVALAALAIVVAVLAAGRAADRRDQAARLEAFRAEPPGIAPSLGADLEIPDSLPFTRLRLLATHNSYRAAGTWLGLFLVGLVEPEWPAKLAYAHRPLRDQLDSGIRSFELDLRPKGLGFVLSHVPLVDQRSAAPDFALALEELALWSDRNPGHLPIVVIVEAKDDYAFLDPGLGPWDLAAFGRLDAALREGLGPRLYGPDQFRGDRADLPTARALDGWPTVGELRGRIVFVLHEGERFRKVYTSDRAALEGASLFTCAPSDAPDSAGFAILNDPTDLASIKDALREGLVVRTRADADLESSPGRLEAALASFAQIVSTDFPPYAPAPDGYYASLPGGAYADSGGGPVRGD
ncbi:MAG: hypothetical protein KBC36_12445 [Spirochaetia bacterium]|nr:hypothetical protein [Spirochaetia bacterium]